VTAVSDQVRATPGAAPVIRRVDLREHAGLDAAGYRALMPRAGIAVEAALDAVRPIVADVAARGRAALLDLADRFDGVRPTSLRVPAVALAAALEALDPAVRAGLEESIRRARAGHAAQLPAPVTTTIVAGGTVTTRFVPVGRVGLYVPGGLAVYPSSVVMNVVPAQAAGVGSLAVASPPQRSNGGLPDPTILAACALLEVEEVWAVGGAQAIALLARGLAPGAGGEPGCDPVDLVTGPGNIYVTAAKRLLRGVVGIDSEAGTTEIAVLADDTADPRLVAADLLSQAEHDPAAASVLVTDSAALADAVTAELAIQAAATRHAERVHAALGGPQSAVVLVADLDQGLAVVDAYAAEHLEVHTRDAAAVATRVRNAGAIFVGPWTPVPLGDYCAGSNHVLPTGGTARYAAGLSTLTFLRSQQVVRYDRAALAGSVESVTALAHAEDLPAHAAALAVRFEQDRRLDGGGHA
jgi:histidinol dehydrogenase